MMVMVKMIMVMMMLASDGGDVMVILVAVRDFLLYTRSLFEIRRSTAKSKSE